MQNDGDNLEIIVTPVHGKLRNSLANKLFKIIVMRGGTRSSKTTSIMEALVIWLFTGWLWDEWEGRYIPSGNASVVRKNKTTLKATVMRDIKEIMERRGVSHNVDENKTDRIFSFGDRFIEFIGADDHQKLKGAKRKILYCNEWNELQYKQEFFQLLIRTTEVAIVDFNPDDDQVRIKTELEDKRAVMKGDVSVLVSTYKDNPFLSKEEVNEIENIKNVDPVLWQIYGEWKYGRKIGRIYNNREVVDDEIPEGAKYLGHWLDFWFSSHPAVLVWCRRYNGMIYIRQEMYLTGQTNKNMSDLWEAKGLDKKKIIIYADSAEPKSIAELRGYWWNVKATTKGPDSVDYGIQFVQNLKLAITAGSKQMIIEFKLYCRKLNSSGDPTNEPVKEYDHWMDAMRYCLIMVLNGWKRFVLVNLAEADQDDDDD